MCRAVGVSVDMVALIGAAPRLPIRCMDQNSPRHRTPRLTRDLVDKLPASIDDPGALPELAALQTEAFFDSTLKDVLANRPDSPLWVFAFSSLIWKPGFEEADRRVADAQGWHRALCLGPDTRYRGNPDAPGYALSLDIGGSCRGVALQLPDADLDATLDTLLRREPPFPPVWVEASTDDGPLTCLAFVTHRDLPGYVGDLDLDEIAADLSRAVGLFGSAPDYLLNTVQNLEDASIHDPYLWDLQDRVARYLEAME